MFSLFRSATLAALASVLFTLPAFAATLASLSLSGDYSITSPTTTYASELAIDGSLNGSYDPSLFPTTNALYTLSADLSLNGVPALSVSDSAVGSPADLQNAVDAVTLVGGALLTYEDVLFNLPGGSGTFIYDFQGLVTTPTSVLSSFTIDLKLNSPIGPIFDTAISDFLALSGLNVPGLSGFSFPNNAAGEFQLDITVDVAAVPLPAGGLLIMTALGTMLTLRRRTKG